MEVRINHDPSIPLYEWIINEFTLSGRADFADHLRPYLATLIRPNSQVLDLCCGAGVFSFLLEELAAKVTAIDFAPLMLQHAQQNAARRHSAARFILADVLAYDLLPEHFDTVVFLGNSISDFSLDQFTRLGEKVARTLKADGQWAIHYVDGFYPFVAERYPHEGVQQDHPIQITRRFREYLPEQGAYVETYRNEATGEEYNYTSYLYSAPVVRLAVRSYFELAQTHQLSPQSFLDIFVRR